MGGRMKEIKEKQEKDKTMAWLGSGESFRWLMDMFRTMPWREMSCGWMKFQSTSQ
jgi:hypothetical protein